VRSPADPFNEPQEGRIEQPAQAEDPEAQREVLEEVARELVARGMATPAIFVLESLRPVSFLTAEFLVFLEPFAQAFLKQDKYRVLAEALHDRRNVTWLLDRIEALDDERSGGGRRTEEEAVARDDSDEEVIRRDE